MTANLAQSSTASSPCWTSRRARSRRYRSEVSVTITGSNSSTIAFEGTSPANPVHTGESLTGAPPCGRAG